MLSDTDFERYFGSGVKQKIIKYSDLAHYPTMQDLLPEEKDYRIVLTENKPNCGHWCALLRNGNTYEWWDSYGIMPDGELRFIPTKINQMLGQSRKNLSRLIQTIPKGSKFVYNKKRCQELNDNICTCGRWVVCRMQTEQCGYKLKDFQNLISKKSNELKKPPDILVCDWIIA